jgi:hypothetical protein
VGSYFSGCLWRRINRQFAAGIFKMLAPSSTNLVRTFVRQRAEKPDRSLLKVLLFSLLPGIGLPAPGMNLQPPPAQNAGLVTLVAQRDFLHIGKPSWQP